MPRPHAPCRSRLLAARSPFWRRLACRRRLRGLAPASNSNPLRLAITAPAAGDVTGSVTAPPAEPRREPAAAGAARGPAPSRSLGRRVQRRQGLGAYRPATRSRHHRLGAAHMRRRRLPDIGPGTAARRSPSVRARRSSRSRANTACRRARSCRPTALRSAADMRAGQRLVIPRYVSTPRAPHAPRTAAPAAASAASVLHVHVVARRHPDGIAHATASRSRRSPGPTT